MKCVFQFDNFNIYKNHPLVLNINIFTENHCISLILKISVSSIRPDILDARTPLRMIFLRGMGVRAKKETLSFSRKLSPARKFIFLMKLLILVTPWNIEEKMLKHRRRLGSWFEVSACRRRERRLGSGSTNFRVLLSSTSSLCPSLPLSFSPRPSLHPQWLFLIHQ